MEGILPDLSPELREKVQGFVDTTKKGVKEAGEGIKNLSKEDIEKGLRRGAKKFRNDLDSNKERARQRAAAAHEEEVKEWLLSTGASEEGAAKAAKDSADRFASDFNAKKGDGKDF